MQPTSKSVITRRWSNVPQSIIEAEVLKRRDIIWQQKGTEDVEANSWS